MAKVYKEDMFPICPEFEMLSIKDTEDCPYFNRNSNRCMMFKEENCLPYNECDAFWDYDEESDEE